MKNTIKNACIIRLILALVVFTAVAPSPAHAALDMDNVGGWVWIKDLIYPVAWAQKDPAPAEDVLATIKGLAFIPAYQVLVGVEKVYDTIVTGYSSSIDETDSTPLITASGEFVRDGIVAANFLPLGAKVKIPEVFGDKILVVKDRMAKKHAERVDIWFPSKELARSFGKRKLQVQVLENSI